jgi:hypothetical protein
VLLQGRFSRTLEGQERTFGPRLANQDCQLVIETVYAPDKLVEDAMARYLAELAGTREMLSSCYDDLKSG